MAATVVLQQPNMARQNREGHEQLPYNNNGSNGFTNFGNPQLGFEGAPEGAVNSLGFDFTADFTGGEAYGTSPATLVSTPFSVSSPATLENQYQNHGSYSAFTQVRGIPAMQPNFSALDPSGPTGTSNSQAFFPVDENNFTSFSSPHGDMASSRGSFPASPCFSNANMMDLSFDSQLPVDPGYFPAPVPLQAPIALQTGMQHLVHPQVVASPARSLTPGHSFNMQPPSPTFMIQNWSQGEPVAMSSQTRGLDAAGCSGPSLSARTPLSPSAGVPSVNQMSNDQPQVDIHTKSPGPSTPQRLDNGAWVRNTASGTSGVAPDDRDTLGSNEIKSLRDQEDERAQQEIRAEVEDWLDHSDIGSEPEDTKVARSHLSVQQQQRPRARSTNDVDRIVVTPDLSSHAHQLANAGLRVPSNPTPDEMGGQHSPTRSLRNGLSAVKITNQVFKPESSVEPIHHTQAYAQPATNGNIMAQPPRPAYGESSAAAIYRFYEINKEWDRASVAATIGTNGSRRRSESDVGSLYAASGVSVVVTTTEGREPAKKGNRLFRAGILPNRGGSSKLKRKSSNASQQPPTARDQLAPTQSHELQPSTEVSKRKSSFSMPRIPKISTNVASAAHGPKSPGRVVVETVQNVMMKRNRSKSDLRSPNQPQGIAELWRSQGGPPVSRLGLAPPANPDYGVSQADDDDDDSGDEEEAENFDGTEFDLSVQVGVDITPTPEGFKYHIVKLNPQLDDYLRERLTSEQVKRYKRLLELKEQHLKDAARSKCPNGSYCSANGGHFKTPEADKNADAPTVRFLVMKPGMTEEDLKQPTDCQLQPATFPPGVPLPPVDQLPASFECPLCNKIKEFKKPSDWTKHVHEDVQPFTCTFPECTEAKSFKRKADWVRHENELHRQLESWVCDIGDCKHSCVRKDNFVQHLDREHKIPRIKPRSGRNGGSRSPAMAVGAAWLEAGQQLDHVKTEDAQTILERCFRKSEKSAFDEKCRFCGKSYSTWKKLTVHLAKHMEQISMPVLGLLGSFEPLATAPALMTLTTPSLAQPGSDQMFTNMPFFTEPTEQDDISLTLGINGPIAQDMHTFPPAGFRNPLYADSSISLPYGAMNDFTQAAMIARPHSAASNPGQNMQQFVGQGTSYPPMAHSQMQGMAPTQFRQQYLTPQHSPQHSRRPSQDGGEMQNTYLSPGFPSFMGNQSPSSGFM